MDDPFDDFIAAMQQPRRSIRLVSNGAYTDIADNELLVGDNGDSPYATDFDQLIQQRAQASYGPNGEYLDDLDKESNLAAIQKRTAEVTSPHASINPRTYDRGVLGGIAQCAPGTATTPGQLQQIVFWPGEDRETVAITVTVAPAASANLEGTAGTGSGVQKSRPVARVNWGTRNGQFEIDVDVGTGFEFCISASTVYVSVYQDAGSTITQNLMAAISFYSAARLAPAARTAYLDSQAGGTTRLVKRPNFASSIIGFERDVVTAQYTLTFIDKNNATIGVRVIAPSTYLTSPIILPNDCSAVYVQSNALPSTTTSSRLVFGLF